MECNKVIPLVLDKIVIFEFKSIPSCLQQWLPIINETSKIQCRIVIPQVLDENRCLIIKFPPKFLAFHREKPIHSYLSYRSYIKPIQGIKFKEFKELKKK